MVGDVLLVAMPDRLVFRSATTSSAVVYIADRHFALPDHVIAQFKRRRSTWLRALMPMLVTDLTLHQPPPLTNTWIHRRSLFRVVCVSCNIQNSKNSRATPLFYHLSSSNFRYALVNALTP